MRGPHVRKRLKREARFPAGAGDMRPLLAAAAVLLVFALCAAPALLLFWWE